LGNKLTVRDPRGHATTYGFSGQCAYAFPTTVVNALGHTVEFWYDCNIGRPTQMRAQVAPNAFADTWYQYNDLLERLRLVTLPSGGTKAFDYDDGARRITTTASQSSCGGGSQSSRELYDPLGRLVRTEVDSGDSTVDIVVTRLATNGAGIEAKAFDYLPFGQDIPRGVNGRGDTFPPADVSLERERLRFTGKERDQETGLDYFGARYFSGAMGRWTSPDPLHFQAEMLTDPQRFNLYGYVRNNPLKFVDPKGEEIELVGNEEERRKILEALRSAVGNQAGRHLQEKQTKTWFGLGKTRYAVGLTDEKAFANVGIVPPGTDVQGDVGGKVRIVAYPQGSEGTTGPIGGGLGVRLLDPTAPYGKVPGILTRRSRNQTGYPL
jgi:RHS repeat-associated protein